MSKIVIVSAQEEAQAVVDLAFSKRITHSTSTNATSSRSHAFCKITLTPSQLEQSSADASGGSGVAAEGWGGTLTIVDLAGSERRKDAYFHKLVCSISNRSIQRMATFVPIDSSCVRILYDAVVKARVEEMQDINWSLACLKACLQALTKCVFETSNGGYSMHVSALQYRYPTQIAS